MNRTLKLIHFIALALFLGSILAWVVLSETSPTTPACWRRRDSKSRPAPGR